MIDLLHVYVCDNCGDVLEDEVETVESIDTENDEVYRNKVCMKCSSEVESKVELIDGDPSPVFQHVDHERWLWATGFYDSFIEGPF